jgi:hypothetical protein
MIQMLQPDIEPWNITEDLNLQSPERVSEKLRSVVKCAKYKENCSPLRSIVAKTSNNFLDKSTSCDIQ